MSWLKEFLLLMSGRIYRKLGGDTAELTRRANALLTSELTEPPEMPADARQAWLGKMLTLQQSPELQWLLSDIAASQKTLSFEEARNYEQVAWGRATANGLLLLKDRLNGYQHELEELTRKQEAFNPYAGV